MTPSSMIFDFKLLKTTITAKLNFGGLSHFGLLLGPNQFQICGVCRQPRPQLLYIATMAKTLRTAKTVALLYLYSQHTLCILSAYSMYTISTFSGYSQCTHRIFSEYSQDFSILEIFCNHIKIQCWLSNDTRSMIFDSIF